MSGHSKWHSIKHKKAHVDAKRGKIFTQHARQITVAARAGGGDPEMNPGLRLAIDNAKSDNVPNDNIDRAIKKGTGELKDGAIIEEVVYEGYGPEGVAILITALTDNTNRTLANVKDIMNKNGGKLGSMGSVSYMFARKGVLEVNVGGDYDALELTVIESGAEDMERNGDVLMVFTAPDSLEDVKEKIKDFGVLSAGVQMVPNDTVEVLDTEKAEQVLKLLDLIEDDEDVNQVTSNVDIPDGVLE
jgi:YebC/PmpR family DNA-binding regulatory protein